MLVGCLGGCKRLGIVRSLGLWVLVLGLFTVGLVLGFHVYGRIKLCDTVTPDNFVERRALGIRAISRARWRRRLLEGALL
jgi:hypothetical protein